LKRLQGGATNVHAVLEERQRRKNSKEMYYAAVSICFKAQRSDDSYRSSLNPIKEKLTSSYFFNDCMNNRLTQTIFWRWQAPHVMAIVYICLGFFFYSQLGNKSLAMTSFHWPTPMDYEHLPLEDITQPTASGVAHSGCFGCVRSHGKQFHEGIDIKATKKDRKGRVQDPIYAFYAGRIAYINAIAGNSAYGIYVVIEHPELKPALYSLYAHLQATAPGLKVGQIVPAGACIGTMGHSSSTKIPLSRAHLHFEIGLRLSNDFNTWYQHQKDLSPNRHGNWNGLNLVGIDPWDFFQNVQATKDIPAYLANLPVAFTVEIATTHIPDFVRRYPTLLQNQLPTPGCLRGWAIDFTWYGLPIHWKALQQHPTGTLAQPQISIRNPSMAQQMRARKMIVLDKNNQPQMGKQLRQTLDILFKKP